MLTKVVEDLFKSCHYSDMKGGLELLKKEHPYMLIIMLTPYSEKEKVLNSFNSGAKAYCVKDIKTAEFIHKIMKEAENGKTDTDTNTFETYNISAREKEVISLVSEGMTNNEIAEKLFISKNTVRNHIANIINKLSVKDRTQIAVFASKNNISSS